MPVSFVERIMFLSQENKPTNAGELRHTLDQALGIITPDPDRWEDTPQAKRGGKERRQRSPNTEALPDHPE
jgi:hypothetical protein